MIRKDLIHLTALLSCVYSNVLHDQNKDDLTVLYEWKQLEFDYPTPSDRERDIRSGNFVPQRCTPIDMDIYYSNEGFNKIFITTPKSQQGIPVTLGTISTSKIVNGNPVIEPYPSWDWHTEPERCKNERMITVFRVAIDECDRLWVLDNGRLVDRIICPPQILIFDLKTDKLIKRYEIPPTQFESRSAFGTLVVEILDKRYRCQNTFAYLADVRAYSIVVYDFKRDISWRTSDKSMFPDPDFGKFTIQGQSFELMDGVLGMCLSPESEGRRKLYYHAMSSPTENWVYTHDLRNKFLFTNNNTSPGIFHTLPGRRQTQVAAEAIDSNGIMYFGLITDVQMACYNTKEGNYASWKASDIIGDNPTTLQFASGVKVIKNKKGEEELWVLTCRYQRAATSTLNTNEINFRIQAAKVDDLVHGTRCMKLDIFHHHRKHS